MWALLRRLAGVLLGGAEKMLSTKLGSWIAGALVFLGLSLGTTRAVKYAVDNWVIDGLAKVPGDMVAWLSWLNFDAAIGVILSGYAAAASTKAAYGGVLKLQARNAASGIPNGTHH